MSASETRLLASVGPRPTDAEIDIFGLTHLGKVRPSNQDHFLICQVRKQIQVHSTSLPDASLNPIGGDRLAFLMMVADGVGGGASGEEASRFALQAITRYVNESIHSYYTTETGDHESFSRALSEAAMRCHADLVRRGGARDRAGSEMATTLTLLIGVWPWAYLVQLGDSRYYLFRDGQLNQISRDQTFAQELIDQGIVSLPGLKTRWANVLSSALGGSTAAPVVTRVGLERSYVHLLCSDGLTKHVPDEQIAARLRSMTSSEQACRALLQDALDGGGSDNVTIIVGRTRG
jgi:serine/threonine protein phosphatase PrpC